MDQILYRILKRWWQGLKTSELQHTATTNVIHGHGYNWTKVEEGGCQPVRGYHEKWWSSAQLIRLSATLWNFLTSLWSKQTKSSEATGTAAWQGRNFQVLDTTISFFQGFSCVSRLCISHLCFQVVGWVASFLHSRLETVASEWDFWWVATSSRLLRLSEAPWVFSPANGKLLSSWNQCPVLSGFVAVSNVFGTVSRPQCNSEL